MGIEATVLIPTHDHGRLLEHAAGSALRQTVSEIEVFIVGDGVDEVTRQIALQLAKGDARVRFFDNPKGPRHGEIHRHQALQEATGRIVCYLSDDDLWLPEHLATMLDLLDEADFAHALPVGIRPGGSVEVWLGHLEVPSSRARVVGLENFIPFSCGGHTLELYRRLPEGWRTTPEGAHTDVYMWSQLLSAPDCIAHSGDRVTVLHFPSPWRQAMTIEQRLDELEDWGSRMESADFAMELTRKVIAQVNLHRAIVDQELRTRKLEVAALEEEAKVSADRTDVLETDLEGTRAELHSTSVELDRARADFDKRVGQLEEELKEELEASRSREDQLTRERDLVTGSLTWRIRNSLLRVPGVAALVRRVGTARARRARS